MVKLVDAYPNAAATRPRERVTLHLELENEGEAVSGVLRAELREMAAVVASARTKLEVEPGRHCLSIDLQVPDADARGYEAVLSLDVEDDSFRASTAVLVASHWHLAPRYGFLSEFPPGDDDSAPVRELAKFHLTVIQFYDWMYRHYRFLPPKPEFEDAMGRQLSLDTVRSRIEACHARGMAALAYGAVYGPEPEFIERHPEWVLRDRNGQMLSLIDLFYITDLRPESGWREEILQEFERAVRDVEFDGIHMDQYGFPKWSYDAAGEPVDLAECFPGLIDEAARRVRRHDEEAAVLFNAVNNWPVEKVAASDQAAVYIEVWSPHDTYRDLVDLVRRARDLSEKQVILAAYLEPFKEGGEGAEHCARLATAVIASAGGFHLLLGEGDGVLRDPYYANHGHLRPDFARLMRRYYDHTAANHHYLFDPRLHDVTTSFLGGINEEIIVTGAKVRPFPETGSVWANVKQRGDTFVINLVNLVGQDDSDWDVAKKAPRPLDGLRLKLSAHFDVERIVWSSPDDDETARVLSVEQSADGTSVRLPELHYWATLTVGVK